MNDSFPRNRHGACLYYNNQRWLLNYQPSTKVWATLTRGMLVVHLTIVPVVLPFTGCTAALDTTGASSWLFSGSLGDPLPLPNSQLRNCIGLLPRGQQDPPPPILSSCPCYRASRLFYHLSGFQRSLLLGKGRAPDHGAAEAAAQDPSLKASEIYRCVFAADGDSQS